MHMYEMRRRKKKREVIDNKKKKLSSMATTTSKWQNRSKVMCAVFAIKEKREQNGDD